MLRPQERDVDPGRTRVQACNADGSRGTHANRARAGVCVGKGNLGRAQGCRRDAVRLGAPDGCEGVDARRRRTAADAASWVAGYRDRGYQRGRAPGAVALGRRAGSHNIGSLGGFGTVRTRCERTGGGSRGRADEVVEGSLFGPRRHPRGCCRAVAIAVAAPALRSATRLRGDAGPGRPTP